MVIHRAQLVLGLVTFGGSTIPVIIQATQPGHPSDELPRDRSLCLCVNIFTELGLPINDDDDNSAVPHISAQNYICIT